MAAAQIKIEMYDPALNSLQTVIRCQPNNLKAHFRRAKAYIGKNDMNMAIKCLQKCKELAPDDAEVQKEINNVTKIIEKQKVNERELARRMFYGRDAKNDPENLSKTKNSNNNSKRKVCIEY